MAEYTEGLCPLATDSSYHATSHHERDNSSIVLLSDPHVALLVPTERDNYCEKDFFFLPHTHTL